MDTSSKYVFRNIGPYTVSTGWRAEGAEALVEVTIRRDKLGTGDHAEDIQLTLAGLLVEALEKRYNPPKR